MKKASAALALLAALVCLSAWNIRHLDTFTRELEMRVERSRQFWLAGDAAGAEEELSRALALWYGAEGYTHVFLRHAEADSVTDAFFDIFAALEQEDKSSAGAEYDRLTAHLDCIDSMEHVTWKSVF